MVSAWINGNFALLDWDWYYIDWSRSKVKCSGRVNWIYLNSGCAGYLFGVGNLLSLLITCVNQQNCGRPWNWINYWRKRNAKETVSSQKAWDSAKKIIDNSKLLAKTGLLSPGIFY